MLSYNRVKMLSEYFKNMQFNGNNIENQFKQSCVLKNIKILILTSFKAISSSVFSYINKGTVLD